MTFRQRRGEIICLLSRALCRMQPGREHAAEKSAETSRRGPCLLGEEAAQCDSKERQRMNSAEIARTEA